MAKKRLDEIIGKAVKESIEKVLNESSDIEIQDETFEYAKLLPTQTGLNVVVYADDGGAYIRNHHTLVMLFQNGYTESAELLPIQVDNIPTPLFSLEKINISQEDYYDILCFISFNSKLLKSFADEEISHIMFYNALKKCVHSHPVQSVIAEMATLRKEDSHLPTTLWIDEGTKPQHGPRIKFKASAEQRNTREFTSMSISQEPEIFNFPKDSFLSSDDIMKIEEFVRQNDENLRKVANGTMTYQLFLTQMIIP